MTLRINDEYTVAVGSHEDVLLFIAQRHAKPGWPLSVEEAWWPEAIKYGLDSDPDWIDGETGLAIWSVAGGVQVLVAPCDYRASGERFLHALPELVSWLTDVRAVH